MIKTGFQEKQRKRGQDDEAKNFQIEKAMAAEN